MNKTIEHVTTSIEGMRQELKKQQDCYKLALKMTTITISLCTLCFQMADSGSNLYLSRIIPIFCLAIAAIGLMYCARHFNAAQDLHSRITKKWNKY